MPGRNWGTPTDAFAVISTDRLRSSAMYSREDCDCLDYSLMLSIYDLRSILLGRMPITVAYNMVFTTASCVSFACPSWPDAISSQSHSPDIVRSRVRHRLGAQYGRPSHSSDEQDEFVATAIVWLCDIMSKCARDSVQRNAESVALRGWFTTPSDVHYRPGHLFVNCKTRRLKWSQLAWYKSGCLQQY